MPRLVLQTSENACLLTDARIREAIEQVNGITVVNGSGKIWLVEVPAEGDVNDYVAKLKGTDLFKYVEPERKIRVPTVVPKIEQLAVDEDIAKMTEVELRQKLQEIRNVVRWWASQEGDDRCWLDDVKVMETVLPHGEVNFEMPSDLEFIKNCIRFKETRCPKSPKLHEW